MKTVYAVTKDLRIVKTSPSRMIKTKTIFINVCETYEQAERWVALQYLLNA